MSQLICVARIGAAHGVRGEVRLWTFTEDPLAVLQYGPLSTKDGGRAFEVTKAREAKDHLVATIDPPILKHVTNPLTQERGYKGKDMPLVSFDLVDGADYVEILCSPKALGSGRWAALEIFSFPSLGVIEKYVMDCVLRAGSQHCPPVVIGDDSGFSDPAFIKNVGTISQGAINRSAWDIGKPGSVTAKINDLFKAKTGYDLDDTSGRNMQAMFVLADAINRAGSGKSDAIRDALKATDLKPDQLMMGYKGVKFDDTGQNTLAATYLIQLQGDQYVAVWPAKSATAKLQIPYKGW